MKIHTTKTDMMKIGESNRTTELDSYMQIENTLGVKKVQGQSEAAV